MSQIFALCIGASLGAVMRWRLNVGLNSGALIPWGTLLANWLGGYLIGIAIAIFQAMPQLDPLWRLALITGFLGALTTFSSFSAEVITMLMLERYALALGITMLHLLGSLFLTWLGLKTAAIWLH